MGRKRSVRNDVGNRYNSYTVLENLPTSATDNYTVRVRAKCVCGNIKTVQLKNLANNSTKSCGCHKKRLAGINGVSTRFKTTHGKSRSKVWLAWRSMLNRCYRTKDPSYTDYGGRGIKVCPRWRKSFISFLEDMGEPPTKNHSLDRKNNNKGYSPKNCKWSTPMEQGANKRNNIRITIEGRTLTLSEWCRLNKINRPTAYARIRHGWTPQEAVSIPQQKYVRK